MSRKDVLIPWDILSEVHLKKRPSINQTPEWQSFTGFHIHQPTRLVWNWISVWGTCANCSELAWSLNAVGRSAKTPRAVSLRPHGLRFFIIYFFLTWQLLTLMNAKSEMKRQRDDGSLKQTHGLTFKWQLRWKRLRVLLTVTSHDLIPPPVTNHVSFRLDTRVPAYSFFFF